MRVSAQIEINAPPEAVWGEGEEPNVIALLAVALLIPVAMIQSLVGEWNPEDFENEYRRDLKAMLDAKLAGETLTRPEPAPEAPVIDLMEALRQSVAEVKDRKSGAAGARFLERCLSRV